MRPEHADLGYVWDMLQACREASSFAKTSSFEAYLENLMLIRALERSVQVIGEAANQVSLAFRDRYPEVPWQRIADQRHVLVHDYAEIDPSLIWNLVERELPSLIIQLASVLDAHPPDTKS